MSSANIIWSSSEVSDQILKIKADGFVQTVLEHGDKIFKMLPSVEDIPRLEKAEDALRLGQIFIDMNMLAVSVRNPQFKDEDKKKWPKHLLVAQNVKNMPEKAFLVWNIEKSKGTLSIYLTVGIALMIGILLFPIWPLNVKIVIWYISFYFLVFFVSDCFLYSRLDYLL